MLTVTLDQVKDEIAAEYRFTAERAIDALGLPGVFPDLGRVTLCVMVLKNGFVAVGQSACADIANFDAELGRKLAREDALRQAWPVVMSYLQERQ